MKACDGCTECCWHLEQPELGKPARSPCPHECEAGCAIYEDRPGNGAALCQSSFACHWKRGLVPWRPDEYGVVITGSSQPGDTLEVLWR